jgi:hypothetical protein
VESRYLTSAILPARLSGLSSRGPALVAIEISASQLFVDPGFLNPPSHVRCAKALLVEHGTNAP